MNKPTITLKSDSLIELMNALLAAYAGNDEMISLIQQELGEAENREQIEAVASKYAEVVR